ncbi:MAG: hypothetical protein GY906_39480 [bacterium]|nr:hypothetical protein [bacterium]
MRNLRGTILLIVAVALAVPAAFGQQVILDNPVRAGELILFPDLDDDNVYYYVSDKPRLAEDENGRPQFSFLRYVENVASGANEAERDEGEGGGILHALVALSVTDDQLREAQRALRRVKSKARIQGPVLFKSGQFGLVTSFANPEGGLSTQVVGLGNAPLLDGEKAAVSMQLTNLGSKILWQSFQTPTPDISFTFEMELDGYRSPKRALLEANFDQIYEHKSFGVGLASKYLAAEIRGAFDDLQRSGAIKLTQVGDDEDMEALISTAYNRIAEMMFQPMQGGGTPNLSSLAGAAGGQQSLLDRATQMLRQNREDTRTSNREVRARNSERRERNERRRAAARESDVAMATAAEERATQLEQQAEQAEARARRARERAQELSAGGEAPEEWTTLNNQLIEGAESSAATYRRLAEEARAEADEIRTGDADEDSDNPGPGGGEEDLEEEESEPTFAIMATFQMKRVRQRGTFTIDLNKYTADSITLRFDENIGDLRRYMNDQQHFRQVNLDDPLYRQREIVAMVDGLNAADFGQYINFATVAMRKRHQSGEETYDEVRIDRKNFNAEGNAFKLLYGWKGDDDRRRWQTYDYKVNWSFFGGSTVEGDQWVSRESGAINLAPPYQRREVMLEGDPQVLQEERVRAIDVKIFYKLGGKERFSQKTIRTSQEPASQRIEFMLPADEYEYEYEINWTLRGNVNLTSGHQKSTSAVLFVDELPY